MDDSININAKSCCSREKKRLVKALRSCDAYSKDGNERHLCYRSAAKESGSRSKSCMLAD